MKALKPVDSFGERLKARRVAMGFSQAQLAAVKELETSNIMIGRYERGEVKPTIEVLSGLAKALDTTVSYLVGEAKSPTDTELQKLIDDIQSFPEARRNSLVKNFREILNVRT